MLEVCRATLTIARCVGIAASLMRWFVASPVTRRNALSLLRLFTLHGGAIVLATGDTPHLSPVGGEHDDSPMRPANGPNR